MMEILSLIGAILVVSFAGLIVILVGIVIIHAAVYAYEVIESIFDSIKMQKYKKFRLG